LNNWLNLTYNQIKSINQSLSQSINDQYLNHFLVKAVLHCPYSVQFGTDSRRSSVTGAMFLYNVETCLRNYQMS